MTDYPHCYHVNFADETETCCWCSNIRKLRFGQGYFELEVSMAAPLLSIWWWRYNTKMYSMYLRMKQSGTTSVAHGPHGMHEGSFVEYADEEPCSMRKQP